MQAVQIRMAALAGLVDAVRLEPGALLGAKVLERRGDHGLLLLAGAPVVAELPPEVAAGARLRLRVTEAGAERVTLQLVAAETPDTPAPAAAAPGPPAAAFALALPGGAHVRLEVAERDAAGSGGRRGRAASLALRYDSPALGRLDFRIAEGAIAVHASAGEPAVRASAAADELRAAVERATGAPAQVTVHPRTETLDVRG